MILSVLLNNHFGFSIKKRLERGKSGSVETRWGDIAIIQVQNRQDSG